MLRHVACCLLCAASTLFAQFEVSQESSPGAGNFSSNILGSVTPYGAVPVGSASSFYSYGTPNNASWNGLLPAGLPTVQDRSHLLLANTTDGLSLVIIHDSALDGSGGEAEVRIEVFGDPNGATRTVMDDPPAVGADAYTGNAGASVFTCRHQWAVCCTDGVVISGLDPGWWITLRFTEVDNDPFTSPIGNLTTWYAYSSTGALTPLTLQLDREVRIGVASLPQYQLNSFGATLMINGVAGGPFNPAAVTVPIGQTGVLTTFSVYPGLPWDMGTGLSPLIPLNAGAVTSANGQIVNLNLNDPTFSFWFNVLQGPGFQNLTIPFSFPFATSISAQMIVVTPNQPSGITLSQPVRLTVQ